MREPLPATADLKAAARTIFNRALEHCSIERAFDRTLRTCTDERGANLVLGGCEWVPLDRLKRVRIVSIGKAGAAMLTSLLPRLRLPQECSFEGVLIAPARPERLPQSIRCFAGGHPVPNAASFAGASAALSMMRALGNSPAEDALCIFLISGGASAMMELPLDPTVPLDDTIAFHQALVHSGASIVEMNCVRKHFSAVKGGRLALAAGSARRISLMVSDVPPAHLDALASGPTVADSTTVSECLDIIARYGLMRRFPESVRRFFASPRLPETPKPSEMNSDAWTLLDSEALGSAAETEAARVGFYPVIDNTCDDWSYDDAADYLLNRLRRLRREHARVCLISVGEVTVKLPEGPRRIGAGGRNQHFALYAATRLLADDGPIAVLSAGSDGIDGNSGAAGAVIGEGAVEGDSAPGRIAALEALEAFDSATFLNAAGATIVTGATGHNLRDLRLLLAQDGVAP